MNDWLQDHLVCPRDHYRLVWTGDDLTCANSHSYPVFDGIAVMLVEEIESTHDYMGISLEQVRTARCQSPSLRPLGANVHGVDAFVQGEVPYSSGILYKSVQYELPRYPIPHSRLPPGKGERLLDVGCNWGRWSISAARQGYRPVGIDPSLDAVLAARRVAEQLGIRADFVVGDARLLPFADGSFDVGFSYGVYQHFSKPNAKTSIKDMSRVVRPGGQTLLQMPNRYGLRQYQQRRRRGFTEGEGFDVRHWTPAEIIATLEQLVGPSVLSADCYFGLGVQGADRDLLPRRHQAVVVASEFLRWTSGWAPPLRLAADSVYVASIKSIDAGNS